MLLPRLASTGDRRRRRRDVFVVLSVSSFCVLGAAHRPAVCLCGEHRGVSVVVASSRLFFRSRPCRALSAAVASLFRSVTVVFVVSVRLIGMALGPLPSFFRDRLHQPAVRHHRSDARRVASVASNSRTALTPPTASRPQRWPSRLRTCANPQEKPPACPTGGPRTPWNGGACSEVGAPTALGSRRGSTGGAGSAFHGPPCSTVGAGSAFRGPPSSTVGAESPWNAGRAPTSEPGSLWNAAPAPPVEPDRQRRRVPLRDRSADPVPRGPRSTGGPSARRSRSVRRCRTRAPPATGATRRQRTRRRLPAGCT